jgi:hypothetical protein
MATYVESMAKNWRPGDMFCVYCKWWRYQQIDKDEKVHIGKCYRFPPKLTLCAIDRARPMTAELDFCGEFEKLEIDNKGQNGKK